MEPHEYEEDLFLYQIELYNSKQIYRIILKKLIEGKFNDYFLLQMFTSTKPLCFLAAFEQLMKNHKFPTKIHQMINLCIQELKSICIKKIPKIEWGSKFEQSFHLESIYVPIFQFLNKKDWTPLFFLNKAFYCMAWKYYYQKTTFQYKTFQIGKFSSEYILYKHLIMTKPQKSKDLKNEFNEKHIRKGIDFYKEVNQCDYKQNFDFCIKQKNLPVVKLKWKHIPNVMEGCEMYHLSTKNCVPSYYSSQLERVSFKNWKAFLNSTSPFPLVKMLKIWFNPPCELNKKMDYNCFFSLYPMLKKLIIRIDSTKANSKAWQISTGEAFCEKFYEKGISVVFSYHDVYCHYKPNKK